MNLNTPLGTRPPNPHELFYTTVAAEFADTQLCDKISGQAIDESGPDLGSTQWRVQRQRSVCYFYVALQTKNEKFCDSVSGVVTLPSNASEVSATRCRYLISLHRRSDEPAGYYVLPEFLMEMGYTDEDRYAAEYAGNMVGPIGHFFETIRNTETYKQKVRNFPSYDEPYSVDKLRQANGDEILTAWLAAGDSVPELCTKISPNSYDETPRGIRWRVVSVKTAVRNSCFFDVAQSTGKSSFCAKITPIGSTTTGIRSASQKDCESQLKIQARDKSLAFHYGFTFPTMKPFADELRKLGYTQPFIVDEETMDWRHFYQYVRFDAPEETRHEFLKRAESLPKFEK